MGMGGEGVGAVRERAGAVKDDSGEFGQRTYICHRMKKIVVFLSIIISSVIAKGQSFEGKIVYKYSVESRSSMVAKVTLSSVFGTSQQYFIKGAKYKSIGDGMLSLQMYDVSSNRLYNKTNRSDTLYWIDASVNNDSAISFEIKKNQKVILGNNCDAMIVKTVTGTTTYYYCDKYKVQVAAFARHKYGNWWLFVSKTGVLPLGTIIESPTFRLEGVATEISPMKLEDSFFEVSKTAPIKKGF